MIWANWANGLTTSSLKTCLSLSRAQSQSTLGTPQSLLRTITRTTKTISSTKRTNPSRLKGSKSTRMSTLSRRWSSWNQTEIQTYLRPTTRLQTRSSCTLKPALCRKLDARSIRILAINLSSRLRKASMTLSFMTGSPVSLKETLL